MKQEGGGNASRSALRREDRAPGVQLIQRNVLLVSLQVDLCVCVCVCVCVIIRRNEDGCLGATTLTT